MKKIFRGFKLVVLALIAIVVTSSIAFYAYYGILSSGNLSSAGPEAATVHDGAFAFRDLNKNGALDVYEDSRRLVDERVEDLLSQMNLAEKAGLMFITMIAVGQDGELMERPSSSDLSSLASPINSEMVVSKLMNHFNIIAAPEPAILATWHNNIQKLAERTRLGIPITIATDPRHGFSFNEAASIAAGYFSLWPEPIGLAATRDVALVEEFGQIARQEYLAVGIRLALHPMADLATEPRWARSAGTFGEDAELSSKMVYAYVKGFQGDELGPTSVATMVKHFSGGGPQKDGEDAHFPYGKEQVYPGNNFDYHLIPFEDGAFPANAAQIMPYYGIPVGQTDEDVGFAYNRAIITDLLRNKYGFDGVVCSDWGLINDSMMFGVYTVLESRSWGVEDLTPEQRARKLLHAGIDQFGGEYVPELVIELVENGEVDEDRLDESVRRLLRDKFRLGLFDDPYVDAGAANKLVGKEEFRQAGLSAQRKSLVLLKNGTEGKTPSLPLTSESKIYVENIDSEIAARYATVVTDPGDADFAIMRIATPYEPRSGILESFFHSGDLSFKPEEKRRILDVLETVPTIVDIYLDRAAVIPDISAKSTALIANFGATDEVLLDVIFGRFNPTGKLPFELPRSMEAVRNQKEDLPYDSDRPLFQFGHGLSYGPPEIVGNE